MLGNNLKCWVPRSPEILCLSWTNNVIMNQRFQIDLVSFVETSWIKGQDVFWKKEENFWQGHQAIGLASREEIMMGWIVLVEMRCNLSWRRQSHGVDLSITILQWTVILFLVSQEITEICDCGINKLLIICADLIMIVFSWPWSN